MTSFTCSPEARYIADILCQTESGDCVILVVRVLRDQLIFGWTETLFERLLWRYESYPIDSLRLSIQEPTTTLYLGHHVGSVKSSDMKLILDFVGKDTSVCRGCPYLYACCRGNDSHCIYENEGV